MIEDFKINENNNRLKVIEYIKKFNIDCNKFIIKDFLDYPGGIELTDNKNRKIVIYNDYIEGCVKEIYIKYKKDKKQLIDTLWSKYSNEAIIDGETIALKRDSKGNILYYRYKKDEEGNFEKIHESRNFIEVDEMYDIFEYFKTEISKKRRLRRMKKLRNRGIKLR